MDDNTHHRGRDGPSDNSQRVDNIFRALSTTQRRYILYHLQEEERASLPNIAKQVASWENECPIAELSEETIDELETVLSHTHLPTLREAAIIEYDERSEMVVLRDPPELVELYFEQYAPCDLPD